MSETPQFKPPTELEELPTPTKVKKSANLFIDTSVNSSKQVEENNNLITLENNLVTSDELHSPQVSMNISSNVDSHVDTAPQSVNKFIELETQGLAFAAGNILKKKVLANRYNQEDDNSDMEDNFLTLKQRQAKQRAIAWTSCLAVNGIICLVAVLIVILLILVVFFAVFWTPDLSIEHLSQNSFYFDQNSRLVTMEVPTDRGRRLNTFHYRDEGCNSTIANCKNTFVLIHGTFGSLHGWNDWTSTLLSSLGRETTRVIRFDLPSYGLTGPFEFNTPLSYTSNTTTTVIDDLLFKVLQIRTENLILAGNSLGGRIALQYVQRFPNKTTHLVLVSPAGFVPDSTSNETRSGVSFIQSLLSPSIANLVKTITPRFLFEIALRQVYYDYNRITSRTIDLYFHMMRRQGNREAFIYSSSNTQRDALDTLPSSQVLPSINMPVLILWGQYDNWIPVANANKFSSLLPNNTVIIYPDAGHVAQEEIGIRSANDVVDFVKRNT